MDHKGSLNIKNVLSSERRVNAGGSIETLTTQRDILVNDFQQLILSNATTKDAVLPNAQSLTLCWNIIIHVPVSSAASVNIKSYHVSAPVLVKNVIPGKTYMFTCIDTTTTAGTWHITLLKETDDIGASKYIDTFDATTSWGSPSAGYYTHTITAVTHGVGAQPIVEVEELSGSDFVRVGIEEVYKFANGDISIKVPEIPDLRFAGRLIIS